MIESDTCDIYTTELELLSTHLFPKIPPFHCVSEATAWASAHALSMVTWYNQNIVNGYRLIIFALYSNSNPNILLGQTKLRFSCS